MLAAAALWGWTGSKQTEGTVRPETARTALPAGEDAGPTPVLVELFTSEGCSSCPPADALLMKLEREQPVSGVNIITLGEHVDYWDRLGWPDRFSSAAFSQQQQVYAQTLRTDAYTPQMVVDGQLAFVGSDAAFAQAAIRDASRERKVLLDIQVVPSGGESGVVRLRARLSHPISAGPGQVIDAFLAITEANLTTQVGAGENSGRVLHHASVVRDLRRIKKIARPDSEQEFVADVAFSQDWDRSNLRAVVFLQEQRSRRILAAGQVALEGQTQ